MKPLMVRALRGDSPDRVPVWMMRQAGRYLPGYRAMRKNVAFLELCRDPERAAEVSLEPIERFGMDAAIVFADILLTADAMGVEVTFPGTGGPKIVKPLDGPADIDRIHEADASRVQCVAETVALLRKALPPEKAVIGFSAAPVTLCAYMIEGGSSRDFIKLRTFAHHHPKAFETLLERVSDALAPYLIEQIKAGADVVQLFDTWGMVLPPDLYRRYAIPSIQRIIQALGDDRPPVVLFPGIGSGGRLEDAVMAGADALSLDWQTDLVDAYARVGAQVRLQGNLDPAVLRSDPDTIRTTTEAMLARIPAGCSHVANLGHGIHKDTPPEHAAVFIDTVQAHRPAPAATS